MAGDEHHVLVVDDNQVDRLKLTRILEGEGYAVSAAEEGRGALDLLRSQAFDLVLLDVAMPGMNGYEVLEAMMADGNLRGTPVIVISALDEADTEAKCRDLGARDYVSKSSSAEILKARVAACLDT